MHMNLHVCENVHEWFHVPVGEEGGGESCLVKLFAIPPHPIIYDLSLRPFQ